MMIHNLLLLELFKLSTYTYYPTGLPIFLNNPNNTEHLYITGLSTFLNNPSNDGEEDEEED